MSPGISSQAWKIGHVAAPEEQQQWHDDADVVVQNDKSVVSESGDDQRTAYDPGDDSDFSNSPEAAINFVKAISLSALIHPTHEPCSSPELVPKSSVSSGSLLNLVEAQTLLTETCHMFHMSIQVFQHLTDSYFDNMTAFSLFHRPSFGQKIQDIKNPLHLQALFAAMFSYSAKFEPSSSSELRRAPIFHQFALDQIERSIKQLPDQPPPLCLLQAMTIVTFCELTKGVRARAWRLVGSCVRLAYELHMHLIDYEARDEDVKIGRDLARWTKDEERRRCWWAIWEMDTFASTIRRCPTAIDWNMIDTYLPVQDTFWFNNHYHPSCFLEVESTDQWKMLTKYGNENPNSWIIVINVIMRTAQVLLRGNLHGVLLNVNPHNNSDQLLHYFRNSFRKKRTQEDSMRLKTLIQALENVTTNLSNSLLYQGERLDFGCDEAGLVLDIDRAKLHSTKYSIYVTIQLARFMIYHHYAFGEIISGTIFSEKHKAEKQLHSSSGRGPSQNTQGLQNCLQVADDMCALIERCAKDHVRYVNPFHASTVWLAASLQVLRDIFSTGEDMSQTKAKCDTLRSTCGVFTEFWQTPLALLENLDSLASRLSSYRDLSLVTGAKKHSMTPASQPPKLNASFAARLTQPQYGTADEPLGAQSEFRSSCIATNGQFLGSTSGSYDDGTSDAHLAALGPPFQPHISWADAPMDYSAVRTIIDGQIPRGLSDSEYGQPCRRSTPGQDFFTNYELDSSNEVELDKAISQYLLDMFSEQC
ncbi:uncharacterized protein A1O9_07418 [Exophiala aquamarina CBS 119918]|uniref:Xylanolytic transcriptional activator regulatory domain-containing protein n=1 Tax=Exophiala aquamarina CBS 119918 TaxID=1182545 RepID=A0A072PD69_9EURO|nr:uncharacterized protein A1O9_07418 [Exophiala aquamarina CBS 119918]KEF57228.1 hypothetical protein A1O9_07418 [Exophiala aquamarina CBS 119918]